MVYWLDERGSIRGKERRVAVIHSVQTSSRAHSASYSMGTGSLSLEVKLPGRGANNSHPSSAEVKNGGIIPPLPHVFIE
jgi:hypothetical protein